VITVRRRRSDSTPSPDPELYTGHILTANHPYLDGIGICVYPGQFAYVVSMAPKSSLPLYPISGGSFAKSHLDSTVQNSPPGGTCIGVRIEIEL
jgi:hypothetical protein